MKATDPADFLNSLNAGVFAQQVGAALSAVAAGRDQPLLKLRWVGEEAQREAFADEFKQVLQAEVGGLVNLTIGNYQQGK